jgi:hypothetical protein
MRGFKLTPRVHIGQLRQAMLEGRLHEIPGLRVPDGFIPCTATPDHDHQAPESASPSP